MSFPSEHEFALFLFQVFAVLSLALALGETFRRLGQPTVIGEILAGVILGPSVLGTLAPKISSAFFPADQTDMLGSLAWLGSVFLLLVAGTEINLKTLRDERRVVLSTSLLGIAMPFSLGLLLAFQLPDLYLVDPQQRMLFALFLATAVSISAIPVVAKILMDLNLLQTTVGQAVIGSAVVNDIVGWIFFATILSMISSTAAGIASIPKVILLTLGFAILCLTLGKTLIAAFLARFHRLGFPAEGILGLAVLVAFFCAAFTQWIGIHAIFGAFLAGIMIGETGEISNGTRATLRHIVFYVFSPIFFASMGLRANFVTNFDLFLVLAVIVVAAVGKILGASFGAWVGGKKSNEALAIAFGLMPQGAMGIILAFLALESSLINETVFVALVITAIMTSIASGPLINWALRRKTTEVRIAPLTKT